MRTQLAAGLSLFVGIAFLSPAASLGDEVSGDEIDFEALEKDREKDAKKYGVSERMGKRLTKAIELFEAEQYAEAQATLEKRSFQRMNPYEWAVTYRLLAHLAFSQEDGQAAIEYFEKVLEQEVLPLADENSIRFNIAQLYTSLGEWQQVIDALRLWFLYEQEPGPLAYYLLAIAYFQLDQPEQALAPAMRAVELSPEPREGWLQLVAALHITKEDFASARPVLELLVTRFTKKQYWVQLSLIYAAADDYLRSLSVQQLAYAQGLLIEDSELRRLARSYLYHELPYRAAKVLAQGLEEEQIEADQEALELLANSWISAREYDEALAPLQQAAAVSEDGTLYVRLGQVHIQREEWREAARQLEQALAKGGLEDEGNAKLLLAISLYSDGRIGPARRWFANGAQHGATRVQCNAWIDHIDREAAQAEAEAEAQAPTETQTEAQTARRSG